MKWTSKLCHIRVKHNHWWSDWCIHFLLGEQQHDRQYTSAEHISNWIIYIHHSLVYKEHNLLHFRNVDDDFVSMEMYSQHMISKLESIHLLLFRVNFSAFSFMVFNSFRLHAFKDSCIYLEVLQMAQPHIIFWLYVIGRSWGGAKEQSIVSLIIKSGFMACLDPTKPPSSGASMISLCNFCMEHSNKSFGTLRFILVSASAISKYHGLLETDAHLNFSLSNQLFPFSMPCWLFFF